MYKRLAQAALALVLLISPNAEAARRCAVLLIPLDRGAYAPAAQLTEHLEEAVERRPEYSLRQASSALGDSTPTQALAARRRVQTAVNEGKKLLAAGSFDEAEASFRSGLVDVDNAAGAMERCSEYCEALVHLAAVQLIKGEEQGAREALSDLLAIDAGYKFEGPAFGKAFKILYREMQTSMAHEGRLGAVSIQTTPPGGRVFIDGQDKGFSPVTVDRLPVGKHLLRVERPGYITFGQLVDVTNAEGTPIKPRLTATAEYSSLEDGLDAVVDELERDGQSNSLMKLGAKLKVDRALVGTVRTKGSRIKVDLVLVDFAERKKLSRDTRVFLGNEYGELPKEVVRFGNSVLAAADASPDPSLKPESKDPLDHKTGMEEWDEEYGGGSPSRSRSSGSEGGDAQPGTGGGEW